MAPKHQTAIRIPEELLERIDAFAARLEKEQPGFEVNRATAIRVLITAGLEAIEKKSSRAR